MTDCVLTMSQAEKKRLRNGDVVSVAVGVFDDGENGYAKSRGARNAQDQSVRDEATVVGRDGNKWKLHFQQDDADHCFDRKAIHFVRRPTAAALERSSSDEDEAAVPQTPAADSSDDDAIIPQEDHEANAEQDDTGNWTRDDDYSVDERAKHGFTDQNGPRVNNLSDWENASLYQVALHFLPTTFLALMAAKMQANGIAKHDNGDRRYTGWRVTLSDLIQWIGVWMYMLAFPQPGSRRAYWQEPVGGFGPRHRLREYLALGQNGEKGVEWFEQMHTCFALPTKPGTYVSSDRFYQTRFWWESLRDTFYAAIVCSWLMVLDESMVKWMGVGMPGLMVVLRKPTPIGLEVHTLCCALCGILIWFEVYEGKEAMGKAKYCDQYPKSIALTLRMVEPFFSTGRVLIADSWFGSRACALALFMKTIFCVMNVKTAHKNYPKEEILEHVAEIKGKTAEARAARRARRGKSVCFVQTVKIGSRSVTLQAAGNNKKVPLLLISTYGSMLAGKVHVKVWQSNNADGTVTLNTIRTEQPQMHALYRQWMNIVDVHNKLRQGVVSMADVWGTTAWPERHFAEGLGFWEVNVFKCLIYFYQAWKNLSHGEFRMRLAWACMTLGKAPYPGKDRPGDQFRAPEGPADSPAVPQSGQSSAGPSLGGMVAPLPGGSHSYAKVPGTSGRQCAYCPKNAYQWCETCFIAGLGKIHVCGRKSKRPCMDDHVGGKPLLHSSFAMSAGGKHSMLAKRRAQQGDEGDDEDEDEEPMNLIGSLLRQSARVRRP